MAVLLKKFWEILKAGFLCSGRTAAEHDAMFWGDGPKALWSKRIDRS